jgi:glycosyltransferase involved in cell wall biosynthesis
MSAPRVAILIPSYNSAHTIAQTLDCLQDQLPEGVSDISVYLADDGSKDDTVAVARQTWKARTPLRVIARERNLGMWTNKNSVLAEIASNADWVLLLHQDDIVRADWLAVMLDRISHCPASVGSISSEWKSFSRKAELEIYNPAPHPGDNAALKISEIKGTRESIRWTLLRGCWWLISGCAIRLAAFRDVGPFDPQFPYAADFEWVLRCLHKGWDVELVGENLAFRRIHATNFAGRLFLRHVDIRDDIRLYNRYASALAPGELFSLHAKACYSLVRRMASSVLHLNVRRFLGAWSTLFWVLSEFLRSEFLRLMGREASGRIKRLDPGWQ